MNNLRDIPFGGTFEDYKEAKRARDEERRAIREEERHYNWRPGFREQSANPRCGE